MTTAQVQTQVEFAQGVIDYYKVFYQQNPQIQQSVPEQVFLQQELAKYMEQNGQSFVDQQAVNLINSYINIQQPQINYVEQLTEEQLREKELHEMFDLTDEEKRKLTESEGVLQPKYLNEIMSPFLYKDNITGKTINNDILNCSMCSSVNCKSRRTTISTDNKLIHFIVEGFTTGSREEQQVEYISSLAGWLGLSEGMYDVTGTIKCENGNEENCSFNLLRELDYYHDENGYENHMVVMFSNSIPYFFNKDTNNYSYGMTQTVGNKNVLFLPSVQQMFDDDMLRQSMSNILWNTYKSYYTV